MRHRSHGNLLLVELIVVVLFFSLAASITLGVFVQARMVERNTAQAQCAISAANNLFAQLRFQRDAAAVLQARDFVPDGDGFVCREQDVTFTAAVTEEKTVTGSLITVTIDAHDKSGRELLAPLSSTTYFAEEAVP